MPFINSYLIKPVDHHLEIILHYHNLSKKSVGVNFYAMHNMYVSRRFSSLSIIRYFNIPEKSINSRKDQVCHHKTYMFLLFSTKKNEMCT